MWNKDGYYWDAVHCLRTAFETTVPFINLWFLISLLYVSIEGNTRWITGVIRRFPSSPKRPKRTDAQPACSVGIGARSVKVTTHPRRLRMGGAIPLRSQRLHGAHRHNFTFSRRRIFLIFLNFKRTFR
jgi:hypothetical protein